MNERYGQLAVLGEGPREGSQRRRTAVVRCDCGTEKVVRREHLRNGAVTSCGCYRDGLIGDRSRTHGLTRRIPEYRVWCAMRERCSNPSADSYQYYGARGIRVCDRWESFEAFLSDVGRRPSPDHSIDRVDNDGDYEPENVVWADRVQQSNNRRNNRRLTVDGVTLTAAQWARRSGLPETAIRKRMDRGWSDKRTVTEPLEVRARRQREYLDEMDVLRLRNRAARIAAVEFCQGCDDDGRLLDGRFCSHEVEGL